MSVDMSQLDSAFRMPKKHHTKALIAIQRVIINHRDYLCNPEIIPTMYEVFGLCGWIPQFDDTGNIIDLDLDWAHSSFEKELFEAIAPYVSSGSYIDVSYNDGEQFTRYLFENGKCREIPGKIVFEE